MSIHTVSEGQDLFDVAIQRFGQIDNLFDLLADNESLTVNSRLSYYKQRRQGRIEE